MAPKIPPPPSMAPDAKAPKGGVKAGCQNQDQEVELVQIVEMYQDHDGKWKERNPLGRKQFINLDYKIDLKNDHPEYGRAIWLKAKLKWKSGDLRRSLDGKNVYWYSEGSKTNNTKLSKEQKSSFDSEGGDLQKKPSATNREGWTEKVPFYLSLYGGDQFDIYATTDKAYKGGMSAGSRYTVWRKLWFQVSEMEHRSGKGKYELPKAVTDAITNGYSTAKIELTEKEPRGKIPHKGNTPTGDIGNLGKTHFVKDSLVPFKCHLMTCDYGGQITETKPVKDKLEAKAWTSPDWYLLWPHDGALSGKVKAKYKSGKNWKDIPGGNLDTEEHPDQPGFKKVKIDFSKGSVAPTKKDPVDIDLELKCSGPSTYLGWGGGSPHILLCTGMLRDTFVAAERDLTQRSDAVHEIGHALGLVNMAPAAAKAHDKWHDTGHANHCKQPANKCAMFWESSTTRLTTFHSIGGEGCNEHLRTQDFSRTVMEPLWK